MTETDGPMNDSKALMALFESSANTAEAIDELHNLGIPDNQVVVMTGVPYPMGALGRHHTWISLPYIVLAGALAGMLFGLFLAVITPHLYRLDIGGHPTVSFPPTAVIIFVFTMMATIVSTFLGVLWEMEFPRFGTAPYSRKVTDGYLSLMLEYPVELEEQVHQALKANQAQEIREPERMIL
jgi:hypothetical protein